MTYTVTTTVPVAPGSIDELARLFDETNRDLVAGHDDWLGAWFTADREANHVTVIARWTNHEAYELLRSGADFQATMSRFATHFTGPPSVTVNEILVEM